MILEESSVAVSQVTDQTFANEIKEGLVLVDFGRPGVALVKWFHLY